MGDKIYCGSGKVFRFRNGGEKVMLNICLSDIPEEFIKEAKNGKRYTNLELYEKRNGADEHGKTHYVTVNQYRPEHQQSQDSATRNVDNTLGRGYQKPARVPYGGPEDFESDNIPF